MSVIQRRQRRKKTSKAQQALLSFELWVEYGLKQSVNNVLELKKAAPKDLKNPVLVFVVPCAMNSIVERSVLEVCQAWELLNSELKRLGLRTLGASHKDYRHLKRIRNKLVAHRIENLLKSERHVRWYKRTYGSYDSVLGLIQRTAERVAGRIRKLEIIGLFSAKSVSTRATPQITSENIAELLVAVKSHGVY